MVLEFATWLLLAGASGWIAPDTVDPLLTPVKRWVAGILTVSCFVTACVYGFQCVKFLFERAM